MRRSRLYRWALNASVAVAALAPCVAQAQAETASANGGAAAVEVAPGPESPVTPQASADDARLKRLAEKLATPATATAAPANESSPLGSVGPDAAPLTTASFDDDGGSWVLSTLASLGVVIGLILAMRWVWTRMGGVTSVRATPAVEVLSRTSVAPRNHVLLVRVGGRILVLGDSSGGLRTLADVNEPDEVASLLEAVTAAKPTSLSRNFMQVLSQSEGDYNRQRRLEEGGDDGEVHIDQARESVAGLLARVKALSQKGVS